MSDLMDMYLDAANGAGCSQHPATSPPAGERCAWGWSCQNPATEKAGRRAPGRPPADFLPRMVELLARRPDLAGIGWTYLLEAVVAG